MMALRISWNSKDRIVEHTRTQTLERLAGFSVSQISDALGFSHPVETGFKPLDPTFRICGRALPVLCESDDNLAVLHALDEAQKGDALVISCPAQTSTAVWGELLSLAAQSQGLAGTIVDGAVRDVLEIKEMAYPVFSRCINARRARKEKPGGHNIPVRCGSLVVWPGEIVFADANGILAIPASSVSDVLARVEEISRKESDVKQQLLHGVGIVDILKLERSIQNPRMKAAQGSAHKQQ
jgi:4-hydroxy-4-methyl-2-oxoglutarate aldolase